MDKRIFDEIKKKVDEATPEELGEVLKTIKFAQENPVMANKPKITKDQTRNESQEEKINKGLITDYLLFSSDCAENCMRNWKEVQGLFRIKLELKHLLYS